MLLRRMYISKPGALDYFKAPALEELALLEDSDTADVLPPVHSFIACSSCCLRRLCLVSPLAHTTTTILQCSPSLIELVIVHDEDHRSDESNTLIAALRGHTAADPPGIPRIAPRLHLIFFGCQSVCHLDYKAYLEMLQSRRIAESCALTSAALLIADGVKPDPETIRGLHALRQEGLDLLLLGGVEAGEEMSRWDYKTSWI
jgi:hypothetical protein